MSRAQSSRAGGALPSPGVWGALWGYYVVKKHTNSTQTYEILLRTLITTIIIIVIGDTHFCLFSGVRCG